MGLLSFPFIWYKTYRLKRRRKSGGGSDEHYYRQMYSMAVLSHEIEGDKFAGLRNKLTAGIQKDKHSARILDLATGRGYQARNIWDYGYRRVWACDLVPERVSQASRLHGDTGIEFSEGHAARLGFPDAFFDAITISVALHDMTVDEVALTLQGCARMLAPGGRLLALEPRYLGDIRSQLLRSVYPDLLDYLDESIHMREYVSLNVRSMAENLGFECTCLEPVWGGMLCLYGFERSPI